MINWTSSIASLLPYNVGNETTVFLAFSKLALSHYDRLKQSILSENYRHGIATANLLSGLTITMSTKGHLREIAWTLLLDLSKGGFLRSITASLAPLLLPMAYRFEPRLRYGYGR